jgi:LmbE family N-acetylglucosaminyl deacetylase
MTASNIAPHSKLTNLRICAGRIIPVFLFLVGSIGCAANHPPVTQNPEPNDGKLRIIVFGAHPDDAELRAGGTAIQWARLGHHVKFVSVTNGDIGHWQLHGDALAERRLAEVRAADKVLGVETEVLPIHDGELMPTLENRRTITRLIRQWRADIVIAHRPWDYHPDHRYVGVLMQDAAYMVTVPWFCPDTPPLKRNPVFLYSSDNFQKPYPFRPDIVVALDDVIDRKLDAIHELESQLYEGGANGSAAFTKQVPPAGDPAARKKWLRRSGWGQMNIVVANRFRESLVKRYGPEKGKAVRFAEAFEICEYGSQPSEAEIRRLFPFDEKM